MGDLVGFLVGRFTGGFVRLKLGRAVGSGVVDSEGGSVASSSVTVGVSSVGS